MWMSDVKLEDADTASVTYRRGLLETQSISKLGGESKAIEVSHRNK